MRVFVLDSNKKPLNPCHPGKARKLLNQGKASMFKRYPFTIILKEEKPNHVNNKFELKIDPGSRTTGLAILSANNLIWAALLNHRGLQIKDSLLSRKQIRRSRRNRKTRYRQPRFLNRKKPKGWLAPSLMSRVHNIITWVKRLTKLCPINKIAQELVRFDTQKINNPEISGIEYQQGTLFNYEIREYLLEKWGRRCAYCGIQNVPLEIEHIIPKSKSGTNSVNNLTLACRKCNLAKGNQDIKDFLSNKPSILNRILKQCKQTLKDATAVNSTRWKLFNSLKEFNLEIETGTGGMTKYNRTKQGLEKTHWLDATCVGKSTPEKIKVEVIKPLIITATGRGSRQMVKPDKYGFPRTSPKLRQKQFFGFQTGDIVKAVVTKGKKVGTYVGRVAVRKTGSFNIKTAFSTVQGINYKYCKPIHKADGYSYAT
ncbi:RNA-guided endonuclease IscB [Cyanothece sp. BG0011]|uniref:RNA-guided endonuclease IscB n=1 Tax=Cyanothece sp. BG0011 TaxID=2082950 RepID=UPI000D1DA5C0|nr:RNA-guided endonuclease IscB [Cyanothece sp. BG0011]